MSSKTLTEFLDGKLASWHSFSRDHVRVLAEAPGKIDALIAKQEALPAPYRGWRLVHMARSHWADRSNRKRLSARLTGLQGELETARSSIKSGASEHAEELLDGLARHLPAEDASRLRRAERIDRDWGRIESATEDLRDQARSALRKCKRARRAIADSHDGGIMVIPVPVVMALPTPGEDAEYEIRDAKRSLAYLLRLARRHSEGFDRLDLTASQEEAMGPIRDLAKLLDEQDVQAQHDELRGYDETRSDKALKAVLPVLEKAASEIATGYSNVWPRRMGWGRGLARLRAQLVRDNAPAARKDSLRSLIRYAPQF